MASVIQRALRFLNSIQNNVVHGFNELFPKDYLTPALAVSPAVTHHDTKIQKDVSELFDISILWAVPKKRRSVEKRRNRKYGWPQYHYKLFLPKTNLVVCPKCHTHHERGVMCSVCYSEIKKVTEEMQEAIEKELDISVVENEVVVLYEGDDRNSEYFQGKKIVELKKEKPKIFSDNLMQKSTRRKVITGDVTITQEPLK